MLRYCYQQHISMYARLSTNKLEIEKQDCKMSQALEFRLTLAEISLSSGIHSVCNNEPLTAYLNSMASVEKARMYGKAQITDRGTETQR